MKLFFETAVQARAFLAAVPLGLLLGLLLELERGMPGGKGLWDVLLVLLCAAGLALLLFWTKESGLRAYHLLADRRGTSFVPLRHRTGIPKTRSRMAFKRKEGKAGENSGMQVGSGAKS